MVEERGSCSVSGRARILCLFYTNLWLGTMSTTSSISSVITDLDSSNSSLSSLSPLKGVLGLSDWQKVSKRSVAAKAYDTWFMSANPECTTVIFVGVVGSHILYQGTSCMAGHWWKRFQSQQIQQGQPQKQICGG